jgi:AAHS family 4-hydroxybenzoate transporter-like MFS transporter
VRLVLLTALTIIFDGFDNQLLGLALPSIMQDWGLARSAFAPVVSLSYVGMMIGGAAAGRAGDRLGRRTALLASVLIFAVITAAISLSGGPTSLAVLRFIAGVGLGGAIPNAAALAAEYVPVERRPLAVTITIVCVPLGGTLAGLFAVPALTAVGWRGAFAIGGIVPALTALMLFRVLPESPHYVRDAAAPMNTLIGREYRRDTIALWAAFLSCLLAVYLCFSWLPTLLSSAGLGSPVASTGLTLFNLGGVAGALLGGALIARFGSKRTMLTMAAGAVLGTMAMSRMTIGGAESVLPLLAMLTIAGGFINAVQTTMYALAAQVYPTMLRATGVGAASAVGRSGAILSGYAGPWALDRGGSASFFALMAVTLSVTLASLAIVRRHVPGR